MARPLRIQYPNACYHIINRGDNRRPIFSSESDYSFFLEKLSEYVDIYNVKVYAYALMVNHFHIYLCTPEANLTRFMQSLLTSYSMYRNRNEGTGGHVFQGRYKSIIVEHSKYGLELSRYIHLNSVRIQSYNSLPLKEKRKLLRTFKWCSYQSVIGLRKCPKWLKRNICFRISGNLQDKQRDYAEYVEEGLIRDIENPIKYTALQVILGSDSFIDKICRKYVTSQSKLNCPQANKLSSFMKLENLQKEVAEYYQIDREMFFAKFSKNNEPRQMLLFLARKYCRGRYPLVELAVFFGLSANSFGSNVYKFTKRVNCNRELGKKVKELQSILANVKYGN